MEKMPPTPEDGVEISQQVFDGLEFIRQSGVTNMLDRPMVLELAKEWGFEATADWIERVDTRTYAGLIFKGPRVIEGETLDEKLDRMDLEYDDERRSFGEGEPGGTV